MSGQPAGEWIRGKGGVHRFEPAGGILNATDVKPWTASSLNGTVAASVRAELARSGMTQRALARHLRIGVSTLRRRLENRASFTVDEVADIAEVFGIPPMELLSRQRVNVTIGEPQADGENGVCVRLRIEIDEAR